MRLVEKHLITTTNRNYKKIDELCFLSKNLYNVGLYTIRQHFFEEKKFLGYEKLQKQLQEEKQVDYYALPTKVSQQILRLVCKNFQSFFRAVAEYQKQPKKFQGRPKIPKYKHKTQGRNIVVYPIDAINKKLLKQQKIQLSLSEITISSHKKNIQQVRIIPCSRFYKIEVVYEKSAYLISKKDITKSLLVKLKDGSPTSQYLLGYFSKSLQKSICEYCVSKKLRTSLQEKIATKLNSMLKENLYDNVFNQKKLSQQIKSYIKDKPQGEDLAHFNRLLLEISLPLPFALTPSQTNKLDHSRVAGIDIGLDNLASITSNHINLKPVLINGRPLKSINQYYNKKRAQLSSRLKEKKTSRRLQNLAQKRNNIIDDYLHKSSRYIIDLLISHQIGTLVIGKNDGWKQKINIGKKNNQNFVFLPHAQFIKKLHYKAVLAGIHVLIQEESYTSKCSFLDFEDIKKHKKYLGRRTSRGIFKSKQGIKLNADINASANIIRKAIPDAFANGIEGIVVFPKRINPLKAKYGRM